MSISRFLAKASEKKNRIMLAVVATMPLFAGVFLIGSSVVMGAGAIGAAQDRAKRVKCASNLRQIGQAMQLYNADQKEYPRGAYDPAKPLGKGFSGADSKQGKGVEVNDPTTAFFLLIQCCDLTPEVFICPSTAHKEETFGKPPTTKPIFSFLTTQPAVDFSGFENRSNFTSADNLSYSLTNPCPPQRPRILKSSS